MLPRLEPVALPGYYLTYWEGPLCFRTVRLYYNNIVIVYLYKVVRL